MYTERSFASLNPDGAHQIVYSEFAGDPERTVICVHGLSRNGRDFDWLAKSLADKGHRVICPDMAGRGRSAPFKNPASYNYAQYFNDCTNLITHLGVDKVDWVGTSMGGIIGMMIAAQPKNAIRKMVINDIGAFIPRAAVADIKTYVSQNPTYKTWAEYYAAFKIRMASFGLENENQAEYLAMTSLDTLSDGTFRLAYDTNIVAGLQEGAAVTDVNLWPFWDLVNVPVLLLHGADSLLLTEDTIEKMKVGKELEWITFPNVGHAPALMSPAQIEPIVEFLA